MSLSVETQPDTSAQFSVESQRRSSEWDIRCGAQNYLTLVGTQVASSVAAFVAMWLATRVLGTEGYGGVVAILAAAQLVGQITVEWTSVSLWRYGCEEFVETGRIVRAFWGRLAFLAPNLLLVVALSPWWLPPVAGWLRIPPSLHPLIVVHLLVTALWIHVQRALQAAKLPRLHGFLLTVERLLVVAVIGALILAGKPSVVGVALGYIGAPCLTCLIGIWRLRSLVFPGVRLDRPLLRRLLLFSFPLIPYAVVGCLFTNHLDAFFITRFVSVEALAIYAVAYQFVGTAMQLPLHAGSLVQPFFVTLQVDGRDDLVVRFLRDLLPLLTLVWSTLCALAAVAGGFLLPLVFGAQFREIAGFIWPLMAATALAGPWLMGFVPFLTATSATHISSVAGIVSSCTNVVCNILLVPRFGLVGCAWATVAAYGVMMLVGRTFTCRRASVSQVWTLQATLPVLLGAAYATWRADALSALTIALLASAGIALLRHQSLVTGFRTLAATGVWELMLKLGFRRGMGRQW